MSALSLFPDDDDTEDAIVLHVNERYAARFTRHGELVSEQRSRALHERVPVPSELFGSIVERLHHVAVREGKKRDGRYLAIALLRKMHFLVPASIETSKEDGSPPSMEILEALMSSKIGKQCAGDLHKYSISYIKAHPSAMPLSSTLSSPSFSSVKAAAKDGTTIAGSSTRAPESGSKRRRTSDDAADKSAQESDLDAVGILSGRGGEEAVDYLHSRPPLSSAAEGAALSSSSGPAKDRKRHGRGAGRGRGLNYLGEPPFAELHPSWQAKRKSGRHDAKVVSKSLRAREGETPHPPPSGESTTSVKNTRMTF